MFTLHHGNCQERLARRLAAHLRAEPLPPLAEEIVVVQSSGMERWLQLYLAEALGTASQLRFVFPAAYLWELIGMVLPDVPRQSPFARDTLIWRLFRLLAELPDDERFAAPRRYLLDASALKRYALAERLAQSFERYLAYRPQWVSAWLQGLPAEKTALGEHEAWQAWLWRALAGELPQLPREHPQQRFLDELAAGHVPAALPRRLSLFGIAAMPPSYFETFRRLGAQIEVRYYLLSPCREYWGDIVAARHKARAVLQAPQAADYLDSGNSLLASLGKSMRFLADQASGEQSSEEYVEPGNDRLLGILQADMLKLRERGPLADVSLPLAADDASLQIHICHSLLREVEVLHDRLLALFAADANLAPHDVQVLTPDIAALAPLVEAVFATAPPARRIPYAIADLPPLEEAAILRVLDGVFDLTHGRFDAESLLALLAQAPLARRWGFAEPELETLRAWVRESGIRWGLDAQWRQRRGWAADAAHTWRQGLERLLLGLALPSADGRRLFAATLPAFIDGNAARSLGRFISFIDTLAQILDELATPRSLEAWSEYLPQLLGRLCLPAAQADAETQYALQRLRNALSEMAAAATQSACSEALPLDVVRRELAQALQATPPAWAFLGGRVTFAELRAHRAVPSRVVCLLGMNDGAFPRNPPVPGFDLIARHPQAGDRNPRDEDRHAFLEALLSAREVFYLSYVGSSIRDNSALPPSAVLGELFDCIDRSVHVEAGRAVQAIGVRHPLQAFSPQYFDGAHPALFSYAEDYAQASRAAATVRQAAAPFLAEALPEDAELLRIDPAALIRCLQNPARHLLQRRLGLRFESEEALLESAEPFVVAGLEKYRLKQEIVTDVGAGIAPAERQALARARGRLPHGAAGLAELAEADDEVAAFAARVAELMTSDLLPPLPLRFGAHGVDLQGNLGQCRAEGIVRWRAGSLRAEDRLALWVEHLLLNLVAPAGVARFSRLLTPKESMHLAPLTQADAQAHLSALLELYRRACCEALPFFARTSLAWFAHAQSGKGNWRAAWFGSSFGATIPGECEDPHIDLLFAGRDPFDERFAALAAAVYAPLHAALADETQEEAP